MNYKPEPIQRKILRILVVLLLIATSIISSRWVLTEYYFSFWQRQGIKFGSSCFILLLIWLTYKKSSKGVKIKELHIRGMQLIPFEEAYKKSLKLTKKGRTIFWGFLNIPASEGTSHFAIVGASGSGKTMSLRLLMQSVLPEIGSGTDRRALVYDAKSDMLPILKAICPETRIETLNPFDARGVAWDMARDVTTPATCHQLAEALISRSGNSTSQPYFQDTARHLLVGILTVFNKRAKGKWTFRDLMVAKNSLESVKSILECEPETAPQLHHFEREETMKDVFSTFQTRMAQYEFVAAAWDHAERKVSITDWLEGEYVLVLGNNTVAAEATNEINRVMFQRMVELILSQDETESRQTWIFLDEVRQAGKLDSLNQLLIQGRSKGACCVLGFQDVEGMREAYGDKLANELVGQCGHKAVLKLNSPETAEWASKLFGHKEVMVQRSSESESKKSVWSGSITKSKNRVQKAVVTSGEFMALEHAQPSIGVQGYFIVPSVGNYCHKVSGKWVETSLTRKKFAINGFKARTDENQSLKPWLLDDTKRLALDNAILETKNDIDQFAMDTLEISDSSLRNKFTTHSIG